MIAGDVFVCSALPLCMLGINGYRFISKSAMPPALLTLSLTQPDAMDVHTCGTARAV